MRRRSRTKNVIIALLIVIVVVLCALFVVTQFRAQKQTAAVNFVVDNRATEAESAAEEKENPLSGRNIYFSGINDAVINAETVIQLDNVKDNQDFLMKYEIREAGNEKVIFETDLIPSGQHVDWIPGETLQPGIYNLDINEIPYFEESEGNFVALTQGCNTVTIEIVE